MTSVVHLLSRLHRRDKMRPSRVLAIPALAIVLAACGASYFDNDSVTVCGTTICVNTPSALCSVQTRISTLSFEVAVASGHTEARYTIKGNTDLSGPEQKKSYTVYAGNPTRHHTSKPDGNGPFDSSTVEVYEGERRVRSLEFDSDDLCPRS